MSRLARVPGEQGVLRADPQSAGCVWWARDATDARARPLQRGGAGVPSVEVALRSCALGDAIVQPLADERCVATLQRRTLGDSRSELT